jgi:hypothetical protein
MNGLQRAGKSRGLAQLIQGQVIFPGQQGADVTAMGGKDHRLSPCKVMARGNVTRAPTLLQELLDHPQGDPEAMSNLGPGAFLMVISINDPLAEIQRECTHGHTLSRPAQYGYIIY